MAISLKNIEDRVKALEESGVSGWTKGSNSNGYWAKETTTGLIIQWGTTTMNDRSYKTIPLPIAFSDNKFFTNITPSQSQSSDPWEFYIVSKILTSSSISCIINGIGTVTASWLTIGY